MTPGAGEPERARTALVAAAIDIGSNSVLLLTVAVEPGRPVRAVDEALVTTRLGAGLRPGGSLDPGGRARTRAAVTALVARARAAGARRTWAFATGAARDATDGAAFAGELAALGGVPVEVLTGEEEACLAYAAVRGGLGLGDDALLVADVGARTTELCLGTAERVTAAASLPLGALVLAEAHGTDRSRLTRAVAAGLAGSALLAAAREQGARLAFCGGTATALAALDLDLTGHEPHRVHGHVLRRGVRGLGASEQRSVRSARAAHGPPESLLDPERAAILPAGAVVLDGIAAAVGASELVVSDHGVRHGYLARALGADGMPADFRSLWS